MDSKTKKEEETKNMKKNKSKLEKMIEEMKKTYPEMKKRTDIFLFPLYMEKSKLWKEEYMKFIIDLNVLPFFPRFDLSPPSRACNAPKSEIPKIRENEGARENSAAPATAQSVRLIGGGFPRCSPPRECTRARAALALHTNSRQDPLQHEDVHHLLVLRLLRREA